MINRSVAGSNSHKSLLKKIWWKITKYFVKSVDITSPSTQIMAKNSPVPQQTDRGTTRAISAFRSHRRATQTKAVTMQIRRSTNAPTNKPLTSSIWAISRSLKNSRGCPSTVVGTCKSSRLPRRYAIISVVTSNRSSISIWTSSVTLYFEYSRS